VRAREEYSTLTPALSLREREKGESAPGLFQGRGRKASPRPDGPKGEGGRQVRARAVPKEREEGKSALGLFPLPQGEG